MDLSKAPAQPPPSARALSSDGVSSTVLSHCIYVIQTVGEFSNLSYRVSRLFAVSNKGHTVSEGPRGSVELDAVHT